MYIYNELLIIFFTLIYELLINIFVIKFKYNNIRIKTIIIINSNIKNSINFHNKLQFIFHYLLLELFK